MSRLLQSLLNPMGAILFHDRLYLNTLLSGMVFLSHKFSVCYTKIDTGSAWGETAKLVSKYIDQKIKEI